MEPSFENQPSIQEIMDINRGFEDGEITSEEQLEENSKYNYAIGKNIQTALSVEYIEIESNNFKQPSKKEYLFKSNDIKEITSQISQIDKIIDEYYESKHGRFKNDEQHQNIQELEYKLDKLRTYKRQLVDQMSNK